MLWDLLGVWMTMKKIQSLKSDFFGLVYFLTIQLKCKTVVDLVLFACLDSEIASCLEMRNTKKWDLI